MATIGQIKAARAANKASGGGTGRLNSSSFKKQASGSYVSNITGATSPYVGKPAKGYVAPTVFKGTTPKFGDRGSNVSEYQTYLNTQNQGKAGYIPLKVDSIFGPKTQAASNISTTTLSNGNKIDSIPGMVSDFTNLANKGISTDAEGNSRYADGSFVPEKSAATDYSEQDQQIQNIMEEMKASTDASTNEQIDNLRQKFAQRKAEQAAVNTASSKAVQNALLMGGITGQGSSSQYAPISSQGIVTAQESYGIKQLAALDSAENDAIAEARAAQQAQNYKLMESKINMINDVRQQKLALASKLNEQVALANQQAQIDMAVAQVYDSGITDPAEALKELRKMGVPADAKRVTDTLALLTGSGGTGIIGEYNFYKIDAKRRGQVPVDFNTYQNMDANRKRSIAAAGVVGGYTKEQEKAIDQINTSVTNNSTYKKYNAMKSSADNIEVALGQGTGLGDIAAINQFQKVIDEGAVTRDQDVQLIQGAQSLASSLQAKINKLKRGDQLTEEQRREMLTLTQKMISAQRKAVDKDPGIAAQKKKAERFGVDVGETILGESGSTYNDIVSQGSKAQAAIDSWIDNNPDSPIVENIARFYEQNLSDVAIYEWMRLRGLVK